MLYQNGSISIDNDFARFGSKSYAIDKINTVDVRFTKPGAMGWVICTFIAAIAIWAGLGGGGAGSVVVGVIFAGIAVMLYRNAQVKTYKLYLVTSSSEAQAFETRDEDEIGSLRASIEQAIAAYRRQS